MTDNRLTLGQQGEAVALRYLEERGYRLLARNWRCTFGELDLVMGDGDVIVFIEVRTRRDGIESAFMSVDERKQRKLRLAILAFLEAHGWEDAATRLDVIAVHLKPGTLHGTLSHAQDALSW